MNIKLNQVYHIQQAPKEIPLKLFEFPGGEVGVKILEKIHYFESALVIDAKITSSKEAFALALLKDAVDNVISAWDWKPKIKLNMAYVPYARQDRVCDTGESNSIKVFCKFINSLKFDSVTIVDPHSDVTPALLDNCRVIHQSEVFNNALSQSKILKKFFAEANGDYILVAPDSGALKKIFKISNNVAVCNKVRDVTNGNIIGMELSSGNIEGKDCLLVDDICDGGKTFIECAKVLKAKGAKKVGLFVSHGIISKGTAPLKESLDFIVTTDSFSDIEEYGFLERIKI